MEEGVDGDPEHPRVALGDAGQRHEEAVVVASGTSDVTLVGED